jgi:pyruvate carboxylase
MYPKVFLDWSKYRSKFGDVSVLPTPVFFYGMAPGQEVTVDVGPGKSEIVRFVALSEPHADATRTVFYEVNGQPRSVTVADRSLAPERPPVAKAEPGNADHVPAPMPGMVSTISVKAGDTVARGDMLLTIEAMKMEAGVHAERDGRIESVMVTPGQQIDAKDLLIVFRSTKEAK